MSGKKHQPAARHSAFFWRTGEPSVFARALQRGAGQQKESSRRVEEARAQGKKLGTIKDMSRKADKRLEGQR